ncbi:hypothetical protein QG516_25210 [Pedobacter gandavensis]|uniref:hypothetical protein n=1 Tax=Pedobacter gandavensis TaxID=2679963 RepID=UPI0024795873|nr:hypothetical protein [Pedobacter gandavensis]WGQ09816.1 hypothetical protein QG516_25210 [Pedobacter gandavensis]
MMTVNQVIPCPVCKGDIPFDARQLILGVKFSCPTCGAGIGLAVDSRSHVDQAKQKFQMVKDFNKK